MPAPCTTCGGPPAGIFHAWYVAVGRWRQTFARHLFRRHHHRTGLLVIAGLCVHLDMSHRPHRSAGAWSSALLAFYRQGLSHVSLPDDLRTACRPRLAQRGRRRCDCDKIVRHTYDRDGDIVSYHRSQGHLMHALVKTREREASRLDVRFFLQRNFGYTKGDELVCLCALSVDNMRPLTRRLFTQVTSGSLVAFRSALLPWLADPRIVAAENLQMLPVCTWMDQGPSRSAGRV
jgi:hypothetical protein